VTGVHQGFNYCCCCGLLQAAQLQQLWDAFVRQGDKCNRLQEHLGVTEARHTVRVCCITWSLPRILHSRLYLQVAGHAISKLNMQPVFAASCLLDCSSDQL
jgi:hypothetical protein